MPDVTRRERHPDDSFILIACDGIWDVVSSAECGKMLRDYREEHPLDEEPAHQILEVLFDEIIAEDIHDQ